MIITELIAACALIISIVSIFVGFWGVWIQREHSFRSIRPIGNIGITKRENYFGVALSNSGIGPMIIGSVETFNDKGVTKNYLADWIPHEYKQNMDLGTHIEGCAIHPGAQYDFLKYGYNPSNPDDLTISNEIRSMLKDLTIRVKYFDVYNREQPELIQHLNFLEE